MQNERVLVALSGGVDSSVAALLLKEAGFEVVGAFMQLRGTEAPYENAVEEEALGSRDAARVAEHLGIPFQVFNLERPFRQRVVDRFIAEYMKGRTPNPCTLCNRDIKFDVLRSRASGLKVSYIATGHYARAIPPKPGQPGKLLRAKYHRKDQSYFLFTLTQELLAQVLFPLGEMNKEDVKALARERGLPVADRQESQDICFIGQEKYGDFIANMLGDKAPGTGKIMDEQGNLLGQHCGFYRYTIGQRKGLDLAAKPSCGLHLPEPVYVTRLVPEENLVIVGNKESTFSSQMVVGDVNWISPELPENDPQIKIKIRYNSPLQPANIKRLEQNRVLVRFDKPQRAITPGQAAVFYSETEVLGGGWIE